MHLNHKEWLKVPILLEELKGLFEELPDEELDNLKKLASEAGKKASETPLRYRNIPTGILP